MVSRAPIRFSLHQINTGRCEPVEADTTYELVKFSDGELVLQNPNPGTVSSSAKTFKRSAPLPGNHSQPPLVLGQISATAATFQLRTHFAVHLRGECLRSNLFNQSDRSFEFISIAKDETLVIVLRQGDEFFFNDREATLQVKVDAEEVQVRSSPAMDADTMKAPVDKEPMAPEDSNDPSNFVGSTLEHTLQENSHMTPAASIARIKAVEETPTLVDGRHRSVSNDPRTLLYNVAVLPQNHKSPHKQEEIVDSAEGETTDEEDDVVSEKTTEEEEEKTEIGNVVTSTASPNIYSTPMDTDATLPDEIANAESTVIVELESQEGDIGQKRAAAALDIDKSVRNKRLKQSEENDNVSDVIGAKPKRGPGRPRKTLASPSVIVEARTPKRAQSFDQSAPNSSAYAKFTGVPPKVIYSNDSIYCNDSKTKGKAKSKKFLTSQGCKEITNAHDEFDFFCVSNDGLKRTGKLLISVARGKQLVRDSWVEESYKAGTLLDPEQFLPHDSEQTKAWGLNVANVAGKPKEDIFAGIHVYITPALQKAYGDSGLDDIEFILRLVGAKDVITEPQLECDEDGKYCVLVKENDPDASTLQAAGHTLYSKDIVSMSILGGRLDLESKEHRIEAMSSQPKKTGKKARKS